MARNRNRGIVGERTNPGMGREMPPPPLEGCGAVSGEGQSLRKIPQQLDSRGGLSPWERVPMGVQQHGVCEGTSQFKKKKHRRGDVKKMAGRNGSLQMPQPRFFCSPRGCTKLLHSLQCAQKKITPAFCVRHLCPSIHWCTS